MISRTRLIVTALAAIAVLWLAYRIVDRLYLTPRHQSLTRIADAQSEINKYNQAKHDRKRLDTELKRFENMTLGVDLETVDHRLRTRLNRLAEHAGLQTPNVTTAPPVRRSSPARTVFKGAAQR